MAAAEIDTSLYPKNLRMSYCTNEEREWWGWQNKRQGRAVAIQCLPRRKFGWAVYFVNGAELGKLDIGGPGENGLKSCVDGLEKLGFKLTLLSTCPERLVD